MTENDLNKRPLGRMLLNFCGALGWGLGIACQAPFWWWFLHYAGWLK